VVEGAWVSRVKWYLFARGCCACGCSILHAYLNGYKYSTKFTDASASNFYKLLFISWVTIIEHESSRTIFNPLPNQIPRICVR
jgi:hypothetical protein